MDEAGAWHTTSARARPPPGRGSYPMLNDTAEHTARLKYKRSYSFGG
jgi:hypothetical protein